MSIPADFIDRIKAEVSIREWVGKTIQLKRNGKEYKGLCCFHAEKTPSFTVYDDKFKCFGCGEQGDVIDFVQRTQGIDWLDAVALLAQDASMTLPNGHAGHVPPELKEPIQARSKPALEPAEDWQPSTPPEGVAPPEMRGFDKVYIYKDTDGHPIRYVGRKEATEQRGKVFTPFTWGLLNGLGGWYAKHPKIRSLYNLDQLAARPDAPVLIVEGEKAADAASKQFSDHICVTWSAGSAQGAIKVADWSPLKGRDVTIWPDNDVPGHKAAVEIEGILTTVAAKIATLKVDDLPHKADAADVKIDHPVEWLKQRLPPENIEKSLPYFTFQDAEAALDAADFVEGLLIERAMSVVYGESNTGKTFWATDLALHIASGMSWCGREVTQGAVLYLALEGSHGIRNRIAAFKAKHGMDDCQIPFAVVTIGLNLLDPDADASAVIATCKAISAKFETPVCMIVVDTLARAMAGGNENAPEDMGALVKTGDLLRESSGAHVMYIHHSGKDTAKGARGHSSLRAATDTEIEITADGKSRQAEVRKQRDLEGGDIWRFELEPITLGENRRGKDVTSCVVKVIGDIEETKETFQETFSSNRLKSLKGHMRRAYDVLIDCMHGSDFGFGAPPGVKSIPEAWWRNRFYENAMAGAEIKAKQKAFRRASDDLVNDHYVALRAGRVWPVSEKYDIHADAYGDKGDKNGDI